MATKVLKELAVAVSSYVDRNTGQNKNRYENIGVLMESENQDGTKNRFLMLKRSFNPAGVPTKEGSDKILISMFDPRPRDGEQGGNSGGAQGGGYDQGGYGGGSQGGGQGGVDEDSIPF